MKFGLIGLAGAFIMAVFLMGCAQSGNPVSPAALTPVSLSVAFSGPGNELSLMKTNAVGAVDSLVIDSAVVVLHRIKLESHIEDVEVDSTGETEDQDEESEEDLVFWGPFVVHVRDNVSIDFASQSIPAGTYTGVKVKIHRLAPGEDFEDSDVHNGRGNPALNGVPYGSSIVVWGSVFKEGQWVPFVFEFDGEFEFKIEGNFTIPETTGVVDLAFHFDLGAWFRNPQSGELLDPTDTTTTNRSLFRQAIRNSFQSGKGGHDDDDDGLPDGVSDDWSAEN